MINDLTKYYEIRDRIKTGDDLHFASFSALGLCIRFVTKAPVNHTAKIVVMTDETGHKRVYIVEAMENGMQTRYLSERLQQFSGAVYWCPIRADFENIRPHFARAISEFQDRMDIEWIKYDYWAIVKQLFGRVGQDGSKMFCSEAAWMLTERAIEISDNKLAKHIMGILKNNWNGKAPTPGDLYYSGLYQSRQQIM
ncbi:MAG: hypothetical protein PHG91_14225 [Syntrophales bacterium]|nr:hypothetical protein [Syntrophales bacterium]